MKLMIKEKKISIRDSFTVKDEYGNDRYQVVGKFLETSKKLHIKDMQGNEVASIREKKISLKPKFYLYIRDEKVGEIVKDRAMIGDKYHITGLDWKIKGNDAYHDYKIVKEGRKIAEIRKKRLAMTDTYVLDIENAVEEIPALAAILAINYMAAEEEDEEEN